MTSIPETKYGNDFSDREISCESELVEIFKELHSSGLIGGEILYATCYVSIDSFLRIVNFCRFDGVDYYHIGPYKLKIRIKHTNDS